MVMGYFQSKQQEAEYNQGDYDGRKDAARRWGERDVTNKSHYYSQGYSDGYRCGSVN